MNRPRTTISRMVSIVCLLIACFAFAPAEANAHGDLIHVIGIVGSVSDSGVSVKTRDGKIVEVQFGEKTNYLRGKAAIDKGSETRCQSLVEIALGANAGSTYSRDQNGAVNSFTHTRRMSPPTNIDVRRLRILLKPIFLRRA